MIGLCLPNLGLQSTHLYGARERTSVVFFVFHSPELLFRGNKIASRSLELVFRSLEIPISRDPRISYFEGTR